MTNVIIELTTYPNDQITSTLNDPNYAVSLVTDPIGTDRLERIEKKLRLGGQIVVVDDGVMDLEKIERFCQQYNAQLIVLD